MVKFMVRVRIKNDVNYMIGQLLKLVRIKNDVNYMIGQLLKLGIQLV